MNWTWRLLELFIAAAAVSAEIIFFPVSGKRDWLLDFWKRAPLECDNWRYIYVFPACGKIIAKMICNKSKKILKAWSTENKLASTVDLPALTTLSRCKSLQDIVRDSNRHLTWFSLTSRELSVAWAKKVCGIFGTGKGSVLMEEIQRRQNMYPSRLLYSDHYRAGAFTFQ